MNLLLCLVLALQDGGPVPYEKFVELSKIENGSNVLAVAFSHDGKMLVTADSGTRDRVVLRDPATGEEKSLLAEHKTPWHVAFTPDDKCVVSAGWDGRIAIWDLAEGKETRTLTGLVNIVIGMAISADGKWIAGTCDKTIIWDARTGKPKATIDPTFHALAFSPSGKILAGAEMDTILLMDTGTGKEIRRLGKESSLPVRMNGFRSVVFSKDGKYVLAAHSSKTAKLFDVASGVESATYRGHPGEVQCAVFAPDGKTVASASTVIIISEQKTGKKRIALEGHKENVRGLAFSPDGRTLVSVGNDETIRFWGVKP